MNATVINEAMKMNIDDTLTWPEVVLILGVVWAVVWCIKSI